MPILQPQILISKINDAKVELERKSMRVINIETAYTWAGRAIAAFQMRRMADAVELWLEAVEHSALAGTDVLTELRQMVHQLGFKE